MRNIFYLSTISIALLFSGCATPGVEEYSANGYNRIKSYELGTVTGVRAVAISDSGMGTFVGAIVGSVLGSTVGKGNGNTLATLAGGLGGSYAGKEIAKSNASELTVKLDNGRNIVVVVKGKQFSINDRVKIVKDGNRAEQVYKIQ